MKSLLGHFGLEAYNFNFYSLRRGGATAYFFATGSLEKTLVKGRWESASTARIYIQDAAAQAAELALDALQIQRLQNAALSLKPFMR